MSEFTMSIVDGLGELVTEGQERIAALEAEVERLREACRSTIEAIYAGAEPWMLRELEAQILAALAPTGDGGGEG